MSQIEISKIDGSIAIRKLRPDGVTYTPYTYHAIIGIRSVFPVITEDLGVINLDNSNKGTYPYEDKLQVIIQFNSENLTKEYFDIQQVTNQPTWTHDEAGLLIALADINGWLLAGASGSLAAIALDTAAIKVATEGIEDDLEAAVRTHNTVSTLALGSVPAGSIRGSVINIGDEDGTWNGIIIPAGVSIPWGDVANRDTYGAIAYDPTLGGAGTTFIIEYTT
jgi:hypothetical protein